jgi:predicted ATPase
MNSYKEKQTSKIQVRDMKLFSGIERKSKSYEIEMKFLAKMNSKFVNKIIRKTLCGSGHVRRMERRTLDLKFKEDVCGDLK